MELALAGLQWSTCVIYLDDVIVFGKTFEEHLARLAEVLGRFRSAGLKLKPEKCHFFQKEVKFLGYLVSAEGVKPHPDNIQKIVNWPTPEDATDIRAILGMGNYYRRFIRGFSEKVQPLVELTKQNVPFIWDKNCQSAFELLKKELTGAGLVAHPRDDGQFILDTDASAKTIGCVLSQVQDGKERVIAYGSRTLSRTEQNYCVTDRELLAVQYFMDYYRQYLIGQKFLVRTDHQAIRWLSSLKDPKDRTARWLEILSAYNFTIEYRPGKKHGNADSMSRRRCDPADCQCPLLDEEQEIILACGPCKKCLRRAETMDSGLINSQGEVLTQATKEPQGKKTVPTSSIGIQTDADAELEEVPLPKPPRKKKHGRTGRHRDQLNRVICRQVQTGQQLETELLPDSSEELREKQLDDPDLAPVIKWLENGKRPFGPEVAATSQTTRHYWRYWDSLSLIDGVLFRCQEKRDGSGTLKQLIVPRKLKGEVLRHLHKGLLGGHFGQCRTIDQVLRDYYWHEVRIDTRLYVEQCDTCQQVKEPQKSPIAPLGKIPIGGPLDRLAVDILGPLPLSTKNNRYILVATDYFTKWVEILAIPNQTAEICAEVLLNEVFSRFGNPYSLHSDQGRNFESKLMTDLCRMQEIRRTRTSPRNPKCNGQVERFNRTLLTMIKCYLKGEQNRWDRHLGCLAGAYRQTRHESTGMSPNLMMLGREVRTAVEIEFGIRTYKQFGHPATYVMELRRKLQHAHDLARHHLIGVGLRRKENYNREVNFEPYKIGDLVLLQTEKDQLNITPKLRVPYQGPYVVYRTQGVTYELVLKDGKKYWVNYNRLKPYKGIKYPAGYLKHLEAAKAEESERLASLA